MEAEVDKRDVRGDAAEIAQLAAANGLAGRAGEWISGGLTPEQVAQEILRARATSGTATFSGDGFDMPERDRRRYSYARAILIAAGEATGGVEAEVAVELDRGMPGARKHGGILAPIRLRSQLDTRALDSKTVSKGPELVFEQAGELIELLRARTAVIALGARVLTGLTAPIAFPRQSSPMTAYWIAENPVSDVASSDIGLGLALLAPKTLQATTAYSRQLLVQVSLDVEAMVRSELAIVHAMAIDRAAIHGLGAAGEPTGIYKAANVTPSSTGGAMDYQHLITMQGLIAGLNADSGALGWIMHPTMATNLRKTLDFPAVAAGRPIWTGPYGDGVVAGYRAIASAQVSSTMTGSEATGGSEIGAVFGNWNDLIIGSWGAVELVVDPFTLKKRGMIEVTSFQMTDILCRHGESFVKATGATG